MLKASQSTDSFCFSTATVKRARNTATQRIFSKGHNFEICFRIQFYIKADDASDFSTLLTRAQT